MKKFTCLHAPHPSALFEPHRTPFAAVIHSVDERNWFGPKCSHDGKMVKKAAAGMAEERKEAHAT